MWRWPTCPLPNGVQDTSRVLVLLPGPVADLVSRHTRRKVFISLRIMHVLHDVCGIHDGGRVFVAAGIPDHCPSIPYKNCRKRFKASPWPAGREQCA